MTQKLTCAFLCLLTLSAASQSTCATPTDKQPTEIPLCLVAQQVVATLNQYNGEASDKLPPLTKAIFDFKTTVATTAGFSFNIFIFSLKGSHEKDITNDVSFTYARPIVPKYELAAPSFSETLLKTLRAAATQAKQTQTIGSTKLASVTISLAFGVIWDGSGGITAPIQLVTVGGTLERKRSDIQTLTLTFGEAPAH